MDRELEREVEGLPARRIRTDRAVDIAAVARAECFTVLRGARAPRREQVRGRDTIEIADADLVRGCEIGDAARTERREERAGGSVETGTVVVLARGQVRDARAQAASSSPAK